MKKPIKCNSRRALAYVKNDLDLMARNYSLIVGVLPMEDVAIFYFNVIM